MKSTHVKNNENSIRTDNLGINNHRCLTNWGIMYIIIIILLAFCKNNLAQQLYKKTIRQ